MKKINWEKVREIAERNERLVAFDAWNKIVCFDFDGVKIHNPFLCDCALEEVDPVEYYGEAFLKSEFIKEN